MANEEKEDLSQLKGPVAWQRFLGTFLLLAILVFACGFVVCFIIMDEVITTIPDRFLKTFFSWVVVPATFLVPLEVNAHWWWKRNHLGHTVWWWKDADGQWQVTAKEYPTQAQGLVIEVHVRAKPSFRIMWGPKGWWCVEYRRVNGNSVGFLANRHGERVRFSLPDNIPPGLNAEVIKLLCHSDIWRIVPLDAGRVLLFKDHLGVGMEFKHTESETDLEDILQSVACFHYRMGQRNSARDLRNERDYAQGERDALKNEREETWQWMCRLLNHLHEQVRTASRPPAKIVALEAIGWILTRLLEELPPDHQLRRDHGVSAEELESVRGALATERGKVGRREGPSPRPSPTEERGE